MRVGKSISELAKEIERQAKTKKDFVADTAKIEMTPEVKELVTRRWAEYKIG